MAPIPWINRSSKTMDSINSEGADQPVPDIDSMSSVASASTPAGGTQGFNPFSSLLQFRDDESMSLEALLPEGGIKSPVLPVPGAWREDEDSGSLAGERMSRDDDTHPDFVVMQEPSDSSGSGDTSYFTPRDSEDTGDVNTDDFIKMQIRPNDESQRLTDEFFANEFPLGPPLPKKDLASHSGSNLFQRTEEVSHGPLQTVPSTEDRMEINLAVRGAALRQRNQVSLAPLAMPADNSPQQSGISPARSRPGSAPSPSGKVRSHGRPRSNNRHSPYPFTRSRDTSQSPNLGRDPNARQALNEVRGNYTCCIACIAYSVPCDHDWPCGICQIDGTRCELVLCDRSSDCPKRRFGQKCIFLHDDQRDEIHKAQGDNLDGEPIPYMGKDLPLKTGVDHKGYSNNVVPEEVLARYPFRPKLEEAKQRVGDYRRRSAHAARGSNTMATAPARGRPPVRGLYANVTADIMDS